MMRQVQGTPNHSHRCLSRIVRSNLIHVNRTMAPVATHSMEPNTFPVKEIDIGDSGEWNHRLSMIRGRLPSCAELTEESGASGPETTPRNDASAMIDAVPCADLTGA